VIYPPPDLDYKAVLIKIGKGLHYLQTGEPLEEFFEATATLVFRLRPLDRKLLANLQAFGSNDDFFHYGGGRRTWFCRVVPVVYRTVFARVLFTDERTAQQGEAMATGELAEDSGQSL
jgi:hypothetical protein